MKARYESDWEQIHFDSVLVDLHAHPSLNVSLFHRTLTSRLYPSSRAFDPFSVRTDVSRLQTGDVEALLSRVYALRHIIPRIWKRSIC